LVRVDLRRRAMAAAKAWAMAEAEGRILKPGQNAPRSSSPKAGEPIKEPHKHFGKLFGVSKDYANMAHALLRDDPLAAEAVPSSPQSRGEGRARGISVILPLPPKLPGSMALRELARRGAAAEGSRVQLRQGEVGGIEEHGPGPGIQLRDLDREPGERLRGNG